MMATDKDSARAAVAELVAKFDAIPKRTRDEFTEQQTRVSFILPLFSALGWDIANPAEMSAEEQISRGFVDFGFYLNGVPVFYLETKRVREDVSRPEFMQQAINYAYLKGVTWAVLTDFEDLMVFNAEWEESSPERARFLEIPYKDYATDRFDDLWYLSKASLATREIDRVAERFGKKSKREPVTTILFKQLTQWRRDLFASIQQLGDTLWANDAHEVDNAVQKLIDRLIFIRSMEDRGVEQPRLQPLMRVAKREKLWGEMQGLFRELDSAYNSNLFANSGIDMVNIYNPDLLREIIKGLYEVPGSSVARYNFNAIDADVLGAVYEQYLGFKAQDPEGKTALDPRKREKRKAQGIYYTPKFVVRYIVQQTLGKLLAEGADAHTLRILDPACGSGSFLIEAFDVLDRHLATTEPHVPDGERRQRILRENLYGVDLDDQAVEVTRLNLALRAAYDRSKLPYLTHIRHGNSLIDDAAVAGATAFRWETEFAEVFAQGGFDVVIGNPPYGADYSKDEQTLIDKHFQVGVTDTYALFLERGIARLLKQNGLLGYITPDTFMRKERLRAVREILLTSVSLLEVIETGPVFAEVPDTWCSILTVQNIAPVEETFVQHKNISRFVVSAKERLERFGAQKWDNDTKIRQKLWLHDSNLIFGYLTSDAEQGVIGKLKSHKRLGQLRDVYRISRGEEGSKTRISVKNDGDYLMVIPENIDRYSVSGGQRISSTGLTKNKVKDLYSHPKIWAIRIQKLRWKQRIVCAFDESKNSAGMKTLQVVISTTDSINDLKYLQGVMASKLINFWCINFLVDDMNQTYLEQLPIRTIDPANAADVAAHDRIVALVDDMLRLKREFAAESAVLSERRHILSEQIARTDAAIDAAVYALYGLTAEEIALVEG
jgi:predicted RNA methylase